MTIRPVSLERAIVALIALACASPLARSQCAFDKVPATENMTGARLGQSVDIHGATVILGAPGSGPGGNSAYIVDAMSGMVLHTLSDPDSQTYNEFGVSVAVSPTYAVVGDERDEDLGQDAGAAYVWDVAAGVLLHKLLAADGEPGDSFGRSVAIDGALVVVGAPNDDDFNHASGAIYVFDAATGVQLHKRANPSSSNSAQLGTSVAIEGDLVVAGAPGQSGLASSSGAAYVFDLSAGTGPLSLYALDGAPGDKLGNSVAISGGRALIGADRDDDQGTESGSAYFFDASTGQQLAKWVASDGESGDHFGLRVALGPELAIVASYRDDDLGWDAGASYVFEPDAGDELLKLTPEGSSDGDEVGWGVAVSAGFAVLGAPGDDQVVASGGAAYLFSVVDLNDNGLFDACEGLVTVYCSPAAPNTLSATGAALEVSGVPSALLNNLKFTVSDLPPAMPGIFFYGPFQTQIPFGNGWICVGGSVNRVTPALFADPTGTVSLPVDLSQPPFGSGAGAVLPGSTWNFQFWYRDPAGFPTTFNLSDAAEIVFVP